MRYCEVCEKFVFEDCHSSSERYNKEPEKKITKKKDLFSTFICCLCGSKEGKIVVKQTRGLDEDATIFQICNSCKKTVKK